MENKGQKDMINKRRAGEKRGKPPESPFFGKEVGKIN